MKNSSDFNLSTTHLSTTQSYLHKPQEYLFELEDDSPTAALSQGVYHTVEDWVALELTAEQMLENRVNLVTAYAAEDARNMWEAIKDNLLPYELVVGQYLLKAADPTQVEWLQSHWWEHSDEPVEQTENNPLH